MSVRIMEAHRGASAHAPENTLAAFRLALACGAPSIELDIHPSRDGALMIIHDPTVDRTTDGRGAVASLTREELRRLDAGCRFPRAAQPGSGFRSWKRCWSCWRRRT